MSRHRHLHVVPPPPTPTVYAIGLYPEALVTDISELQAMGFEVVNHDEERDVDAISPRTHLLGMSQASHLMLPQAWWVSVLAQQLTTVAAWIGMRFVNEYGDPIEPEIPLSDD